MRAAGLDDPCEVALPGAQHLGQVLERWHELAAHRECGAHMDGGRNHIVAALAHVDMVIGMHRAAEPPARQRRDDLVGIHVAAGSRAGLKDVDGELLIVHPGRHLRRGLLHRLRYLRLEELELPVGACRGLFHQAECADERPRHGQAAYGEVLHGALGLRPPQRVRWHLDLTHAVALHPEGRPHACTPQQSAPGRPYALSW